MSLIGKHASLQCTSQRPGLGYILQAGQIAELMKLCILIRTFANTIVHMQIS